MVDEPTNDITAQAIDAQSKLDGFMVVGVGASAGGVGALEQFVKQLEPDCGMAFVVILHLAPQYESNLPAILQNQTRVPVTQVTEGVEVQPNHIYVIPPNNYLVMGDGMIRLTAPERAHGGHTSIDLLFRTLADAYGRDAVAILLSGTGSDGTLGLRRIKEAGGFVIAQDPHEAEYPDMPRNAIESGQVDLVLPIAEIAGKLRALRDSRRELQSAELEKEPDRTDEVKVSAILTFLRERTRHDFSQYKRPMIRRRIARRMQVCELSELDEYLSFLRDHPVEIDALFRDLLITVTNFFRDPDSFEYLRQHIIPRLFAGKGPNDQVRVWSVGCATGEEAYSLAMLLSEYAAQLPEPPKLQVFASDLDDKSIAEARACHYPPTIAIDVTPQRLQRFFVKDQTGYGIKREVREIVLFVVHDVLTDPPFSRLDLICCRNLLIYLNRELQERVLRLLHFALRPDGFLFLGASESAETAHSLFGPVDEKHRIFSPRPLRPPARFDTNWIPPRWQPSPRASHAANEGPVRSMGEIHQAVVEQLAPPSILINREFEIEHVSEHAGRYLQIPGGEPTQDVLKLVRPELRSDLHAALLEAKLSVPGAQVQTRLIRFESEGQPRYLKLTVRPIIHRPEPARGFFLIIFDETEAALVSEAKVLAGGKDAAVLESVNRLEEELRHTKDQLRLTVEQYEGSMEELRGSNEELQATNEQLRSASEELQTSKEELESLNEEITTVNQQYRIKLEELSRANSDLQNVMAATAIGTIFLDGELQIQRYTPSAERIFNITTTDIGRPLEHFTHKLAYDSLATDAREVLRSLQVIEREVRSLNGSWYSVRLFPYRTVDDRIAGVVLTVVDITARRQTEQQLREQAQIASFAEVFTRDAEDRILFWSPACERLYGYASHEAVGKNAHELLKTEWPRAADKINAEPRKGGQWEGELVHTTRAGNRIAVASRWALIKQEPNHPSIILQLDHKAPEHHQAQKPSIQSDPDQNCAQSQDAS